jgi:glycosyltransferase involved in cell wall biosynthesis
MNSNPVVSVVMITYGHENYILQAIESVLAQECNFEFELILANDCSPDKTNKIIEDFLKNNEKANLLKYFNHPKNLGMMPNFIFSLQQCSGKYIAICEGDDYWIDSKKLQKQVDFLEANLQYVLHSGVAKKLEYNHTENYIGKDTIEKTFVLEDFYSQNNIVTCTVLFKNAIREFPKIFDTVTFGDWFLYCLLLNKTNGKAFRSQEVFSVYRITENGVMKSLSKIKNSKEHIFQILKIKKTVGYKIFSDKTKSALTNHFSTIFKVQIVNFRFIAAIGTFLRNFAVVKDLKICKQYLILVFNLATKKMGL